MPWIDHPARQGEKATVADWLRWHVSQWMLRVGVDMEHRALYPDETPCPDCGQWVRPGHECDHIPF